MGPIRYQSGPDKTPKGTYLVFDIVVIAAKDYFVNYQHGWILIERYFLNDCRLRAIVH